MFPLPWSHYIKLLSVDNPHARELYEAEALRGGWTVKQLTRQINSAFYERTALWRNKAAMLTEHNRRKAGSGGCGWGMRGIASICCSIIGD